MQWLNGRQFARRGFLSFAHVPSSKRLPPISSLGQLLALDLQILFSYRFRPAKGIAVLHPSNL